MTHFFTTAPSGGANIGEVMLTAPLRSALALLAMVVAPLGAHAHAEAGSSVENVELRTITGGVEKVLSPKAKANVIVFFRTGQERSIDALVQLATCEKLYAGKPVHWIGVVSSTEEPAAVKTLVARTGIAMPVVVDEGDLLYGALGIRLHPMVAFTDARFKLAAIEMYRQIDYCEIIKGRIALLLGEINQAAYELLVNPPKGTMPGEDVRDVARRDVNLGRQLLRRKQYDKALSSATRALERAPVAAAYSLMGDVWAARGDCAKAVKQYDQALKLDPKDPPALDGKAACAGK
jgi:tetratricopeptide (TPR) repeat protein